MGRKAAPETCRVVIPIKMEFSASDDFIRKESVTMHGHMIVKHLDNCRLADQVLHSQKLNSRFSHDPFFSQETYVRLHRLSEKQFTVTSK